MRLVIARCSVDYEGRLAAHLPEAVRLVMVKADGCVAIHADGGAYKPLNWMNAPNVLVEAEGVWTVTNTKDERLVITFHEVLLDQAHELGVDPGLRKDGVEAHLQELLAGQPEVWDTLTRKFEAQLIHTALEITRGRRIEAAQKLGIGRNTITRKIQELGLDD